MLFFRKDDGMASKHLLRLLFLLFALLSESICYSQTTIFSENFNDNHNKWEEGEDSNKIAIIKNGKYFISGLNSENKETFLVPPRIYSKQDWLFEADLDVNQNSTKNTFYGLLFSDSNKNNVIVIGYFPKKDMPTALTKINNFWDESFLLCDSFEIKGKVHIAILHIANRFYYLLNDIPVGISKEQKIEVNDISFILGGEIQMSIDNILLTSQYDNNVRCNEIIQKFNDPPFRYNLYTAEIGNFLMEAKKDSAQSLIKQIEQNTKLLFSQKKLTEAEYAEASLCFAKVLSGFSGLLTNEQDLSKESTKIIALCKKCLLAHRSTYRSSSFFRNTAVEYEMLSTIENLYFNIDYNYDSTFHYLDLMESHLLRSNNKLNSTLSDINIARGNAYRRLGNNHQASLCFLKAMSYFIPNDNRVDLNEKYQPSFLLSWHYFNPNISLSQSSNNDISDTTNYLRALQGYFEATEFDYSVDGNARLDALKRAELIAHKTQNQSFQEANFIQLESYYYEQQNDFKNYENCLKRMDAILSNNPGLVSDFYLNLSHLTAWSDYYFVIRKYDKVLEYLKKLDSYNSQSDYNYLRAYWKTNDTLNAQYYFTKINDSLKNTYKLLRLLDFESQRKFIESKQQNIRAMQCYLFQTRRYLDNEKKLFDINFLYKNLGLEFISNGNVNFFYSDNLIKKAAEVLYKDEVFLNVTSIAETISDSSFSYCGLGFQWSTTDSMNNYPIVTFVVPFSNAYNTIVNSGDTILSINGISMRNITQAEMLEDLNKIKPKQSVDFKFKSSLKDSVFNVSIVKDSIYWFYDHFRFPYVVNTVTKEGKSELLINKFDGKFIQRDANILYQKYIKSLSNKDSIYQYYLSFISNTIKSKSNLVFSGDWAYNNINLETIPFPDSLGNYQFLGDLKKIRLLNNPKDLFKKDTLQYNTNSIALFGYPDYSLKKEEQEKFIKTISVESNPIAYFRGNSLVDGIDKFRPLPATKDEVEEIGKSLQNNGWQTQIYTGANALEERIKHLQSPRILHIATHGFVAKELTTQQEGFLKMKTEDIKQNSMLRSGLAFAGAERTRIDTLDTALDGIEDGILTAEEVQYLNLKGTELVVLSACETGLGESVNGEGVYGLQRAFLTAGAKSILMSLWNVNDNATKELMKSFYRHWLDEGMNKHDALWQAKLDLRNNASHPEWAMPYFWGAFVLIGE